jgi:excisionase family DNA binding protein
MKAPKNLKELTAYLEEQYATLADVAEAQPNCFDEWAVAEIVSATSRAVCRFGGPAGQASRLSDALEIVGRQLAWAREKLAPPSPYFDSAAAANYLRITEQSLYGLVERKRLVPLRGPRRTYRFTKQQLDQYLASPGA